MTKNRKKKIWIWSATLMFAVAILMVLIFTLANGKTSGKVEISGSKEISGIRCANNTQLSLIARDIQPLTYTNEITVAFVEDELSSITYAYEGKYSDWSEADRARDIAETTYGLILTEKYGLDITTFTKNISVSDNTMYASITAANNKNLNSKTAPIFMLSDIHAFPSSLEEMKMAYEDAGFSCIVNK